MPALRLPWRGLTSVSPRPAKISVRHALAAYYEGPRLLYALKLEGKMGNRLVLTRSPGLLAVQHRDPGANQIGVETVHLGRARAKPG